MNDEEQLAEVSKTNGRLSAAGRFYMFLPVLLLGMSVAGHVVMVSFAGDDPGFFVEPDYYKKASHFDDELAQRKENQRLGWRAEVAEFETRDGQARLVLSVRDRLGRPIDATEVRSVGFPNARASLIEVVELSPTQGGEYAGAFRATRPGVWEVRIEATRGEEHFTEVLRLVLEGT